MHALLLLLTPSAAPPAAVPKALQNLQGVWTLTAAEAGNASLPAAWFNKANDFVLVIEGDRYAWRAPTSLGRPRGGANAATTLAVGRVLAHAGTLAADPRSGALDLQLTAGRHRGTKLLALFVVKGDELKIATTNPGGGGERPDKLKAEGHFLYTFRRDARATARRVGSEWDRLAQAASREKPPKR